MHFTVREPMARERRGEADAELQGAATSEQGLTDWYLRNEPHTLLHVGRLAPHLGERRAILSVGVDVAKEYFLARLTCSRIHVVELDAQAVEVSRAIMERLGAAVTYEQGNALVEETGGHMALDAASPTPRNTVRPRAVGAIARPQWDTLLLSQMDYWLDDAMLARLFALAHKNAPIERVVMLSPSLYTMPAGMRDTVKEALRLGGEWWSRHPKLKNFNESHRRSLGHLLRLAAPWQGRLADRYDYPSGTAHILTFQR